MSARSEYKKRRHKSTTEGEAPSGEVYRWRGLNLFQMSEGRSGYLPSLEASVDPSKLTPEQDREMTQQFFRTLETCVLSHRFTRDESPEDPDLIPFSMVPDEDLTWLYAKILASSGLTGGLADQARAFRGERGEMRPASRDGEGLGGSAVTDLGDQPEGVAGPGGDVRPHGVVEGQGVALGAVGEGQEGSGIPSR